MVFCSSPNDLSLVSADTGGGAALGRGRRRGLFAVGDQLAIHSFRRQLESWQRLGVNGCIMIADSDDRILAWPFWFKLGALKVSWAWLRAAYSLGGFGRWPLAYMGEHALCDRIVASSGWQVTKQLGRGQYGTAYLVSWNEETCGEARKGQYKDGEQAVAKVVGLEYLPEQEHNLAFQEVELMRALRHPHIVALRDHFLTKDSLELIIVMEYCNSGDLRGEVKRRTQAADLIPEPQIMTWFVQMTLALNYMHCRHILHRDLKSSNVFLTTSPRGDGEFDVRIGDFGISRVLEGTIDVAATVVGTTYYMSPEVCKAEPYGYKSDIWALGCVLYEMCMLKHAFEGQSLLGLVYKIVSETYEPIPPQYSADLRSLIEDILEKSSSKRPSGQELISRPYVKRFDLFGQAEKDAKEPRNMKDKIEQIDPTSEPVSTPPRAQVPKSMPAPKPEKVVEASPEDPPVRREWRAPPFVSKPAPQHSLPEHELCARVFLSRVRRGLQARRQNWLQVVVSW